MTEPAVTGPAGAQPRMSVQHLAKQFTLRDRHRRSTLTAVDDVILRPQHPYTQRLAAAAPNPRVRRPHAPSAPSTS